MLRSSLALFLICASSSALAQVGRDASADACQATETQTQARAPLEDTGAAPPRSSLTRSKYARPTAAPSGGGADDVIPRARGSKWHNFLPGMFR